MIEPVNAEEFISQPERRKPEQFQHVKLRIDGGVARMTLSRPEHNLLNEAMLRELADGITHAGERDRSEEHTSELQSLAYLVCRLLLEKKKKTVYKNEFQSRADD